MPVSTCTYALTHPLTVLAGQQLQLALKAQSLSSSPLVIASLVLLLVLLVLQVLLRLLLSHQLVAPSRCVHLLGELVGLGELRDASKDPRLILLILSCMAHGGRKRTRTLGLFLGCTITFLLCAMTACESGDPSASRPSPVPAPAPLELSEPAHATENGQQSGA